MSLKQDLIKNVPLFQQNSEVLNQYTEVAGEVFDEMIAAIDNFKTYYDYAHVSEDKLENLSELFDLRFFSNLNEYGRRKFAKDAAKLYKKLGTEQAIEYIFKIIGIVVEVEHMWMLAPVPDANNITYLYNGALKYHAADVGAYFNSNGTLSPVVPLQLINGKSVVTDTGTFVDLKYGSDIYSKWRIYGEEYPVNADMSKYFMIKAPYYNINITEESYNLYVEGNSGLPYIDQEKIRLAKDLVDYTLEEYLGANEVVLGVNLLDLNTDKISDRITVTDDDFFINIDDKLGNFNRISSAGIQSNENFPTIVIRGLSKVPSIPSAEIFGALNVKWNAQLSVPTISISEAFGVSKVFNAILYVNTIPSITTLEGFGAIVVTSRTTLVASSVVSAGVVEQPVIIPSQILSGINIMGESLVGVPLVDFRIKTVTITDGIGDISVPEPIYVKNVNAVTISAVIEIPSTIAFESQSIVKNTTTTLLTAVTSIDAGAFSVDVKLPVVTPSITSDEFITEHLVVKDAGYTFTKVTQEVNESINSSNAFGVSLLAIKVRSYSGIASREVVPTNAKVSFGTLLTSPSILTVESLSTDSKVIFGIRVTTSIDDGIFSTDGVVNNI